VNELLVCVCVCVCVCVSSNRRRSERASSVCVCVCVCVYQVKGGAVNELLVTMYDKLPVGLKTHIAFPPKWFVLRDPCFRSSAC
jgi:hypothetical protein